jgi:hypothetical protein
MDDHDDHDLARSIYGAGVILNAILCVVLTFTGPVWPAFVALASTAMCGERWHTMSRGS